MSRVGRTPITIPNGVTVTVNGTHIVVDGLKGKQELDLPKGISLDINDNVIVVNRSNEEKQTKAFHGLVNRLIVNCIVGVTEGYTKKLELVGTGYRVKKQGSNLVVSAGFSHTVDVVAPDGITLDTEGDTKIIVSGISKQQVGQVAADIRKIRKPEPYKGKGIRYEGEVIRRKAGKAAKA